MNELPEALVLLVKAAREADSGDDYIRATAALLDALESVSDPNLVPVREWDWDDDYTYHRALTCVFHQSLRWGTKNYYARNLHYYGRALPEGGYDRFYPECTCDPIYLRVIRDVTDARAVESMRLRHQIKER